MTGRGSDDHGDDARRHGAGNVRGPGGTWTGYAPSGAARPGTPPTGATRTGAARPGRTRTGANHAGATRTGATRTEAARSGATRDDTGRRDAVPAASPRAGGGDDGAARADHARATRRGLTVLSVVAAFGCLQLLFMIGVEVDRSLRHRGAIAALEAELAELDHEIAGLRDVLDHADDPVYREQLARRQGFMAEGESRVVVLPGATR